MSELAFWSAANLRMLISCWAVEVLRYRPSAQYIYIPVLFWRKDIGLFGPYWKVLASGFFARSSLLRRLVSTDTSYTSIVKAIIIIIMIMTMIIMIIMIMIVVMVTIMKIIGSQ